MSDSVPVINRTATIIEPKEAYLEWARKLDDDEPIIDTMSRQQLTSVYLVEETMDPTDIKRSLRRHWDWIFEEKLHAWHRDPRAWPQRRTFKLFQKWFDIRLIDLVYDMADGPLSQEER